MRELTMREKAPSGSGVARQGRCAVLLSTSDGIESAADLKKDLKKAVDAGLSRADAIRALTLNAAEIYGVADRMGSVEKGKIANLVVMKGEAFDDKTTVEYVFVDGQEFHPSKDLQQGRHRAAEEDRECRVRSYSNEKSDLARSCAVSYSR